MSLHSSNYLESQRCTCDPEHTPPTQPPTLSVLIHCCYLYGSHPAQGKSRFAHTGAGAPSPWGDLCWLRASWLGSPAVSRGTIWGTEHVVATESFPSLRTETDTRDPSSQKLRSVANDCGKRAVVDDRAVQRRADWLVMAGIAIVLTTLIWIHSV